MLLSWHKYGGGKELLKKLYASIGANVVSFPYGPMPTQPLGWFKKPITKVDDFKGMKFRTVGISIDLFTGMGAAVNALPGGEIVPAMDRGLLDAAEFNNASSDRLLGFPDVSKVCMLQSFHQNAEQFEIMFNKTKYDALPEKMKAIIANAVEAASADMSWKAIDRYSQDYIEMQTKQNVKFYKTPDSILQKQLEIFDTVMEKRKDNALFNEIIESQKKFAERAVNWDLDTYVNRRMAYNHYFGKPAAPREEGLTRRMDERNTIRRSPDGVFFCATETRRMRRGRPRTARTAFAMQKLLLFVDKVSTLVGQTFSWLIVGLTLLIYLGSVLALRARSPARVGFRRDDHDVRDAVHDGRRVHAVEEQPRARRRALRLLSAAAAGRPRSHALHPVLHSRRGRVRLGRLHLCRRVVGDQRAFEHHLRGAADLSVQDDHPGRRRDHADPGHRRDHPLHHLPQAGRLAVARGGRRGGRRRQAEGDGPRQGRGHREARPVRRRTGSRKRPANEEGSVVRPFDHGVGRDHRVRADAAAVADDQRPPRAC